MGFISYCMSLSLYIMSSCLMRYSVLMNLLLQLHGGQRSMCGVIVVDAGRSRSTCHGRDAYIHDHTQIFSYYSLFYQLLDSNTYAILREATTETYGPRVYFPSYKFPIYFILQSLLSNLYNKNTKNIDLILLSLSDLTFASGCEGIDNPFIALVARFLFVCAGTRDLSVASQWIGTLVLKN